MLHPTIAGALRDPAADGAPVSVHVCGVVFEGRRRRADAAAHPRAQQPANGEPLRAPSALGRSGPASAALAGGPGDARRRPPVAATLAAKRDRSTPCPYSRPSASGDRRAPRSRCVWGGGVDGQPAAASLDDGADERGVLPRDPALDDGQAQGGMCEFAKPLIPAPAARYRPPGWPVSGVRRAAVVDQVMRPGCDGSPLEWIRTVTSRQCQRGICAYVCKGRERGRLASCSDEESAHLYITFYYRRESLAVGFPTCQFG